jgi:8-oxo-dGTP pyrophosphatase MutT (NUDIX family)
VPNAIAPKKPKFKVKKVRAKRPAAAKATTKPKAGKSATAQKGPKAPKAPAPGLPSARSTGILLRQRSPVDAVLVLWRHDGSPDLPKGHLKASESDTDAALRELYEETGILPARVRLMRTRWFENTYRTRNKRTGRLVNKTVRIFLAEVDGPCVVRVSDHADYAWLRTDDRPALRASVAENPTFASAVEFLLPVS